MGFKVRVGFVMGVSSTKVKPRLGKVWHSVFFSRTQDRVTKLGELTGGPGWPAGPLIPVGPGEP